MKHRKKNPRFKVREYMFPVVLDGKYIIAEFYGSRTTALRRANRFCDLLNRVNTVTATLTD